MGFIWAPQAPAGLRPAVKTSSHTTFLFPCRFLNITPLTKLCNAFCQSLKKASPNFVNLENRINFIFIKLSRQLQQTFSTIDNIFSTTSTSSTTSSRPSRQTSSHQRPDFSVFSPLFSVTTTLLLWNIVFRYLIFCLSIPFFPLEFRG